MQSVTDKIKELLTPRKKQNKTKQRTKPNLSLKRVKIIRQTP